MSNEGPETRSAGPAQASRLIGIDATRGLALLGMVAVHALWVVDAQGNVTWPYALAAGRSAATFAVLAGVGIAFLTGRRRAERTEARPVVARLASRSLVIGLIGLALGEYADPDVTSVILAYYALLFVLAIPLVFLRTRTVVLTGMILVVAMPVTSHLLRTALDTPSGANPSFGYLVGDPVGLFLELTLTGVYPALPWMAYICLGLAIGRLRLSSSRVSGRLLAVGALTAAAAWVISWLLLGPMGGEDRLYAAAPAADMTTTEVTELLIWGPAGTTPTSTWWWLATVAPHSNTPLGLLHTGGVAVALLGALLLATRLGPAPARAAVTAVLSPLAAAGSMPLTLYTAHILFMNSPLDVFDATPGFLVQVAVGLLFASLWHRVHGRGPLEAVVARLS